MDKQLESSQLPRIDPNGPCLVLAPHLAYPTRTGANILIDRRWSTFSRLVPYVDIVGEHAVFRFVNGQQTEATPFSNEARKKNTAAIRTLVRRSHYLHEKYVTHEFTHMAQRYLADPSYSTVVASYLYSLPLLGLDPFGHVRSHLVESHNDELKWYRFLRKSTTNPLAKWTARRSELWSTAVLRSHESTEVVFLHLTEADARGYNHVAPNHKSIVAPIGVTIPEEPPLAQSPNTDVRLLFVGSLGVIMNADALEYFGGRYFPILKQHFGEALHVDVVGNSPVARIESMCEEHGWRLHPNAPDELLHELLRRASFTLLPFEYATGAKLKLLESLAHGVPFLATSHVMAQLESIPPSCLLADDPADWLAHVEAMQKKGQSLDERSALVEIAKQHSWEASARGVFEYLTGS